MTVGILSLTWGYNYGASLQGYALRKTLETLGHDAWIIDYQPSRYRPLSPWRGWGIRRPSWSCFRAKANQALRLGRYTRNYDHFKERHLRMTPRCVNPSGIAALAAGFQALVVGSDQVWNPAYGADPVFYLWLEGYRGRKISYAACCGDESIPAPDWANGALAEFAAISVRNSFTARWLARDCPDAVEPAVVVDPTVLLPLDSYPRPEPPRLPDEFIACYLLGPGDDAAHRGILAALRARHGNLPVVCLMATGMGGPMRAWADQTLWQLTPFTWLECIRRARALYTDSFHALLFALRFHVDFRAVWFEDVRAGRFREIAERFDLQQHIFAARDALIQTEPPLLDWQRIDAALETERSASLAWLQNALDAHG